MELDFLPVGVSLNAGAGRETMQQRRAMKINGEDLG
jgi:hypothetical protein